MTLLHLPAGTLPSPCNCMTVFLTLSLKQFFSPLRVSFSCSWIEASSLVSAWLSASSLPIVVLQVVILFSGVCFSAVDVSFKWFNFAVLSANLLCSPFAVLSWALHLVSLFLTLSRWLFVFWSSTGQSTVICVFCLATVWLSWESSCWVWVTSCNSFSAQVMNSLHQDGDMVL